MTFWVTENFPDPVPSRLGLLGSLDMEPGPFDLEFEAPVLERLAPLLGDQAAQAEGEEDADLDDQAEDNEQARGLRWMPDDQTYDLLQHELEM